MSEFYLTFGQRYRREPHPSDRAIHPDGWVTIQAESEEQATQKANSVFLGHWANIYENKPDTGLYPKGELKRI